MKYLCTILLSTIVLLISCTKEEDPVVFIPPPINQIGEWEGVKLIEDFANDTLTSQVISNFIIEIHEDETALITADEMIEAIDWHIFNESKSIVIIRQIPTSDGSTVTRFKNMDIIINEKNKQQWQKTYRRLNTMGEYIGEHTETWTMTK